MSNDELIEELTIPQCVKVEKGEKCDAGIVMYLQSLRRDGPVRVTVRRSWTVSGQPMSKDDVYVLAAGAREKLGCSYQPSSPPTFYTFSLLGCEPMK